MPILKIQDNNTLIMKRKSFIIQFCLLPFRLFYIYRSGFNVIMKPFINSYFLIF